MCILNMPATSSEQARQQRQLAAAAATYSKDWPHPVPRRVAVDEAPRDHAARERPALGRHPHRRAQQHRVLHDALCAAAAQLQQAVEHQPACMFCSAW
jgi:hypothetical protein